MGIASLLSTTWRAVVAVALTVAAVPVGAGPAVRADDHAGAGGGGGVYTIYAHRDRETVYAGRGASGPRCTRIDFSTGALFPDIGRLVELTATAGERPDWAHTELRYVTCGGIGDVAFWTTEAGLVELDAVIDAELDRFLERVVIPGIELQVDPESYTLTGLRTRFRTSGWDGASETVTRTVFGITISLTMELGQVRWDFGDGSDPVIGGLGTEDEPVTHIYRSRSTDTSDGAFLAEVQVTVHAGYSLAGGPRRALPSSVATDARPVIVREAQALVWREP